MPASSAISIVKVISTCGLGLLAGYAIATPLLITPAMSSLSTRQTASQLTTTQINSLRVVAASSALTAGLLATTFTLSPARARHPYLLYAAILALSSGVTLETFGVKSLKRIDEMSQGEVNSDRVGEAFDTLRMIGAAVAGSLTLSFAISVVGNYGDFY